MTVRWWPIFSCAFFKKELWPFRNQGHGNKLIADARSSLEHDRDIIPESVELLDLELS